MNLIMVWWYAVRFSLCYSCEQAQTCFLLNTEITSSFPLRIHKYSSLVLLLISSKASDWFTETSLSHAAGHSNQMSVSHRWTLPRCTPTRFCCCETPSNNTFAHGSVWYIYIYRAPLPETRVIGGLTVCGLRWIVAIVFLTKYTRVVAQTERYSGSTVS